MTKIVCKFMNGTTSTVVNPDGQVWPCCYLCNQHYEVESNPLAKQENDHEVLKDYQKNKDKYNLKNDTLKNILNKDWFTKDLPNSFKDPNKAPDECQHICKEEKTLSEMLHEGFEEEQRQRALEEEEDD